MDSRELPYFHKGAQLAFNNILDDYMGNPDTNPLEVIADLEDKRPVVGVIKEDWERTCMVEGARWVGEAVAGWWEEWFGEEEGSDEDDWEDEEYGNEGRNEAEDDVMNEVMDEATGDAVEGGEVDRRNVLMVIEDGEDSSKAESAVPGNGLTSAGINDTGKAQQEVGKTIDENGEAGDLAVDQGPIVEHIISPPDKVGESNDTISD